MSKFQDLAQSLLMQTKGKPNKPEDATETYKVLWGLKSDSFDSMLARSSSSPTPKRLEHSRTFVSKTKAEDLAKKLQEAFNTLGYQSEGYVFIMEDWLE